MGLWPKTLESLAGSARAYMRRHWQRALRVREKLVLSEEAFHLLMAGGVGVLGGLVNLVFYWAVEGAQSLYSSNPRSSIYRRGDGAAIRRSAC